MTKTPGILIVGATSGIAQATARLWAERGARFALVARVPQKLQAVRQDLCVRGAEVVLEKCVDLNHAELQPSLLEECRRALGTIDILLVAHGVLGEQLQLEQTPPQALEIMQTNFSHTATLLLHAAPIFEAQRSGTIVVLSSVAGDRGRSDNYIYGASKAGLSAFLSGLRGRLLGAGVNVITVKPGPVKTAMTAGMENLPLLAEPLVIARGILRAVERGKAIVYLPGVWFWIMGLLQLLPEAIFQKLTGRKD